MQKMFISPSPHIHADVSTRTLMRDVIIALVPVTVLAVMYYGWSELLTLCVSIASCVLIEWAVTRFLMKKPSTTGDLSAALTGLLLALNLPSTTPWWVVLIGAVVAIGVAKMSFGGLGQNVFNPALTARVFLLISFPVYLTTWPQVDINAAWKPGVDAVTGPTILGLIKSGVTAHDVDVFVHSGSAGELSVLALLAGFAYLLIRKVIRPWITLSILGTVAVFTTILWLCSPDVYASPLIEITSGGLLLGSIFMATDYVTSPMTDKGGVIFGIGIGLLTVVIRNWGAYPEGVSFAILIMNAFVPLINKACRSEKFGRA